MKDVKEILDKVEKGELKSKEAADILLSLPCENRRIKYAKKIKIRIHSKGENRRINLPPIPIWFLEKLALTAIIFSRHFNKKGNSHRRNIEERLHNKPEDKEINGLRNGKIKIDTEDLKKLFSILRYTPPCKLVEVNDDDNFVEIFMV